MTMKRGTIVLSLVWVVCAMAFIKSAPASAQGGGADMAFGEEDAQGGEASAEGGQAKAPEEPAAPAAKKKQDKQEGEADVLSTLGIGEEGKEAKKGEKKPAAKKEGGAEKAGEHPIWAIQQIYALKSGRFELMPFYGISMNDPYVVHSAFGVGLNYYITEVLAIGVNFLWFYGFNAQTDTMFHVGRSFRLAVPVNEYQLNTNLNFSYVPLYGKFALFNEWILHWDAWLIGGVGLMRSRPIPMIDPDYRTFDWNNLVEFNVGIGGRLFLSRFLAIFFEIRDYMFLEKVENPVARNDDTWEANKKNWYGSDAFTSNVMVHAGVSIFIPFAFDYELTK